MFIFPLTERSVLSYRKSQNGVKIGKILVDLDPNYPVANSTQTAAKQTKVVTPAVSWYRENRRLTKTMVVPITTQKTQAKRKSVPVQFQPSTKVFPRSGMMRATALPSMILRRVFILGRTKEVVERLL